MDMDVWIDTLLPFTLLLGRVSGFMASAPAFAWKPIPVRMRAALILSVTIFFAMTMPVDLPPTGIHWMRASLLLAQEILVGAALGLMARLAYLGVQQGGRIIGRQMGLLMAKVIDPTTGERSQPVGILFDLSFLLLFLAAGGYRLLMTVLARSYIFLPAGATPQVGLLTEGIVEAGSIMLLFALRMAAPILAAFLVLGVMLAILARVLPEMNLLVASLPLRVGLGLIMAVAILPMLDSFTADLADWISRFLIA